VLTERVYEPRSNTNPSSRIETTKYSWDTAPHGIGLAASETSPDGVVTAYAYDEVGNVVAHSKVPVEGEADAAKDAAGGADAETGSEGASDASEAEAASEEPLASDGPLTVATAYDAFNRPVRVEYPQIDDVRTAVRYTYNPHDSTLDSVSDALAPDSVYFEVLQRDEIGRREVERFGNQVESTRSFNKQRGWLNSINIFLSGAQIGKFDYEYDDRGNLKSRDIWMEGSARLIEAFGYDELDRMRDWWRPEAGSTEQDPGRFVWKVHYGYDDIGNLTGRSVYENSSSVETEAVSYEYSGAGGAQPHAVKKRLVNGSLASAFLYDNSGRQWARGAHSVEYTSFDLPRRITGDTDLEARILYSADRSRFRKTVQRGSDKRVTTTYLSGYYERVEEESQETLHKFFIMSGDRTVAQLERRSVDPANASVRYFHQDHLDSVSFSSTHESVIDEPVRHDPFGKRFDPEAVPYLQAPDVPGMPGITRGFGGHEMEIEDFGVINMKGRIFDPLNGRFLSADPFVQEPQWAQSYNRYMYVMGNPLTYTDPSGFLLVSDERFAQLEYGSEEYIKAALRRELDGKASQALSDHQMGQLTEMSQQTNKKTEANSDSKTEELAAGKQGTSEDGKSGPGTKTGAGGDGSSIQIDVVRGSGVTKEQLESTVNDVRAKLETAFGSTQTFDVRGIDNEDYEGVTGEGAAVLLTDDKAEATQFLEKHNNLESLEVRHQISVGLSFMERQDTAGTAVGKVAVVNADKAGARRALLSNAAAHEVGHGLIPGSTGPADHATGGVMAKKVKANTGSLNLTKDFVKRFFDLRKRRNRYDESAARVVLSALGDRLFHFLRMLGLVRCKTPAAGSRRDLGAA